MNQIKKSDFWDYVKFFLMKEQIFRLNNKQGIDRNERDWLEWASREIYKPKYSKFFTNGK